MAFLVLVVLRLELMGLALARQVVYYLSHSTSLDLVFLMVAEIRDR
jgi:hypothetical protein